MEEIIFLERRIAFLEEKIESYENATSSIVNTLPFNIKDIDVINHDKMFLSLVLIKNEKSKRCPVIKVPKEHIQLQINNENLHITEYINTNKHAEISFCNNKWVWKFI